jgi:hypothetical protein
VQTTIIADPQALALLKQIAAQTEDASALDVALVAGGAALAGAFISALASFVGVLMAARTQRVALAAQADLEEKRLRRQAEISAEQLALQLKQLEQTGLLERQKIQASIVTTERLRWLKDLRRQVAEFYSHIEGQLLKLSRTLDPNDVAPFLKEMDGSINEASLRCTSMCLMLNSKVDEQAALFVALNKSIEFVNQVASQKKKDGAAIRYDVEQIKLHKQAAFDAMHRIGEKAWSKVKSLE